MANIPTQNNNPGDIKDPSTGMFHKYENPEEGFTALKNDLQAKITGNTKTGLSGKSTLSDFASTWAPDSDGNNSGQYAQNLAKKLGVTTDTPIGQLSGRLDDFASAIADNEGYQGTRVLSDTESGPSAQKLSTTDFANKIRQKYGAYQDVDDNTLTQKFLARYPVYADRVNTGSTTDPASTTTPKSFDDLIKNQGTSAPASEQKTGVINDINKGDYLGATSDAIQNVGNALTFGGTGELGGEIGKGLAYLGQKANGLVGDKDYSQYVPQPDIGNALAGAGKIVAGAGLLGGGGIVGGLGKTSALANPELAYNIPMDMANFGKLGNAEKLDTLTEALKGASSSGKLVINKAIQEVTPLAEKELGLAPNILSKVLSKGGGLLKGLLKEAGGVGIGVALGDTGKKVYNYLTK